MSRENLVVVVVQKYGENRDGTAILVGEPGLKETAPYDDGKVWLPTGLINHTKELPKSIVELEIPSWLAEQKDLNDFIKE